MAKSAFRLLHNTIFYTNNPCDFYAMAVTKGTEASELQSMGFRRKLRRYHCLLLAKIFLPVAAGFTFIIGLGISRQVWRGYAVSVRYPPTLLIQTPPSLYESDGSAVIDSNNNTMSSSLTATTILSTIASTSCCISSERRDDPKLQLDPFRDSFQIAKVDESKIHFYSAFYDDRDHDNVKVRVNLAAPLSWEKKATHLSCFLLAEDGRVVVSLVSITLHRENFALKYASFFLDCLTGRGSFTKVFVTARKGMTEIADRDVFQNVPEGVQVLKIHQFESPLSENDTSLAVCIKPIHNEFNRALWLVEFMEFYKLLGASHFVFYNHTIGPDVEDVLNYYVMTNEATVMTWNLQLKTKREIRTEAMFLALNDCNLRLVNRFKYVAMVDLDEFLIPQSPSIHPNVSTLTTLPQLISDYELKSGGSVGSLKGGSWIFRNVFFYLYHDNDTQVMDKFGREVFNDGSALPYLLTQTKTIRLKKVHKPGIRSKYVSMPHATDWVGNHRVWKHIKGYVSRKLGVRDGLSYHYRICEFGGFDCLKLKSQVDRTAQLWAPWLLPAVKQSCDKIFKGPCPKAPPLGSPW